MKYRTWSFSFVFILLVALLSAFPKLLDARDADPAGLIFAQAQSTKQQRVNICRARYRDCLSRKEIPSFECKAVYQDCTHSII
jgi:hypothetical protein